MTEDCVFEASAGLYVDGRRVEVNGCDLFTFRDGRIAVKNWFRTNRPPLGG